MTPADLKKLISCLDLTDLGENCTENNIQKLCQQAVTSQGTVASICVYPQFVAHAWKLLINTPIKIATVINFPHATDSMEKIQADIQQAILDGAAELDAVMPKTGDKSEFVKFCKKLGGDKIILKIILETGELSPAEILHNSQVAIAHGADFLKTSTGKISVGATPEAAKIMLTQIKNSGKPIGFKASGGVRTLEDAEIYVSLAKEILGESAFSPNQFRIGASKLLEEILCAFPNQN